MNKVDYFYYSHYTMKKILSLVAIFVLSIATTSAYTTSQLDSAYILAWEGIIEEKSWWSMDYNLDQNVLRQEVAAVVRWVAGIPKNSTCSNSFSDVSATNPNSWACYSIEALLNANIIALNDSFRPESNITKAEWLGMLLQATCSDYSYNSSQSWSWQEQVVAYASSTNIVNSFTDYSTLATRGWIFEVWVAAMENCNISVSSTEWEIKKIISTTKYDMPLVENGDVIATITTNKGTMKIKIFTNRVPKTSLNFIALSKQWYYNNVMFHRVILDFMIQWWDPDGTGMGWESIYGGNFEDEFHPDLKHMRGTISMANAWPNTNGSQFFINVEDNNFLDNKHSVFWQIVGWMDVVDKISKMQTDTSDKPQEEVRMIDINIQIYNDGKLTNYEFDLEAELGKIEKLSTERDAVIAEEQKAKTEANKDRLATGQDQVLVHYKWTLEDGTTFDSSYDRDEPLEVNLAENLVIAWFKQGIIGMKIGDIKTVTLTPADAYGEYDETRNQDVPLSDLTSAWITPVAGGTVPSMMWELKVIAVTEETVTLDINHPLAGKILNFDIELVDFLD